VLAAATPLRAEAPGRVVSMNLCTDQLALMLAREGQLISVSDIARDPLTSAMHLEAAAYPVNHGGAEEIFLLQPDLVLAGVWSDPATVAMLRGLGIEVAQIDVANSLADIPDLVREVGRLLDRETEAEALSPVSKPISRGLRDMWMARPARRLLLSQRLHARHRNAQP
jgi:iron complex transport system substrate-binding protein